MPSHVSPRRRTRPWSWVLLLVTVLVGAGVVAAAALPALREGVTADPTPDTRASSSPAGTAAPTPEATPTPTPEPTPSATPQDLLAGPPAPDLGPSVAGTYRPEPAAAMDDLPDHYVEGCHQLRTEAEPEFCVYGDPESDVVVALVGDSHAAQWQPGLRAAAEEEGWRLEVYTKSACLFADQEVWIRKDNGPYTTCTQWNERTLARVSERAPDLVVTTMSGTYDAVTPQGKVDAGPEADELLVAGLERSWQALVDAGIEVVVLADTPWYQVEVGDCLAADPQDPARCDADRAPAIADSAKPILDAAIARVPQVHPVDLTSLICTEDVCPAVIDGRVVMRDEHHLTATFSRSLSPWLAAAVDQHLG